MNRFDYVAYDETAKKDQAEFKELFMSLENVVNKTLHKGRYQALVLTSLEEAYCWVGKAIRDDQIKRHKDEPELQEGRSDS